MLTFQAKMHQIRFLLSVRLSVCPYMTCGLTAYRDHDLLLVAAHP